MRSVLEPSPNETRFQPSLYRHLLQQPETIASKFETITTQAQDLLKTGNFFAAFEIFKEFEREFSDMFWTTVLTTVLSDKTFLKQLRLLGQCKALRFVSYQTITIILPSGCRFKIVSPFFVKASPKRRGKKRTGPQSRGCHLGLEVLGFIDKVAPGLAFSAISLAAISPSFEVASVILEGDGIDLSAKKIQRLAYQLMPEKLSDRVALTLTPGETVAGKRVMIVIDGGRFRSRRTKPGPIPHDKKRHGFNADWKEPKLFTIHLLDANGNIIKEVNPHVDGTTGNWKSCLLLLKEYLQQLEIHLASEVILAGDGAPWIWERVPALFEELGVSKERIVEVLDWTHAKQNLYQTLALLPAKLFKLIEKKIKTLKNHLFEGRIEKLLDVIQTVTGIKERSRAVKKFKNYFISNRKRMQYNEFQKGAVRHITKSKRVVFVSYFVVSLL